MSEEGSHRKQAKNQKKALLNNISQTINPIIKDLQSDQNCLQMPELALRCAQFFHSVSEYCVGYYNNYIKQQDIKKRKMIKKQQKQKGNKGGRRDKNREAEHQMSKGSQSKNLQPPKKPLTAYIIYFQDKKPQFVERYKTLGLSELTKLIAKQWKELSQSQKQFYLDKATEDRKRYEEQMSQFKAQYSRIYGKVTADFDAKESNPQDDEIEAIINAQKVALDNRAQKQEENESGKENQIDIQLDGEQQGQEANEAEEIDEEAESSSQAAEANDAKNDSQQQSDGEEQEDASGQAAGQGENGEVQQ